MTPTDPGSLQVAVPFSFEHLEGPLCTGPGELLSNPSMDGFSVSWCLFVGKLCLDARLTRLQQPYKAASTQAERICPPPQLRFQDSSHTFTHIWVLWTLMG